MMYLYDKVSCSPRYLTLAKPYNNPVLTLYGHVQGGRIACTASYGKYPNLEHVTLLSPKIRFYDLF